MSSQAKDEELDKMEQGHDNPSEKQVEKERQQGPNDDEEEGSNATDENNEENVSKPALKESPTDHGKDASTFTQNSHDDSMRHGHVYPIPIDLLNPPMSRREKFRDFILRVLDRPEVQFLGIVVMVSVVVDGAVFFFFLMGWQTLCDTPSKTDCSPRNEIYNLSIQILCWLFTYMATVSMPWRCANSIQVFGCGIRNNSKGLDLYGRPATDVWFHISLWHRGGILICLMLNCLLQYCNQVTRFMFYTYELQDTAPGVFWVNIFFGTSFLFGAVGAAWATICAESLRKKNPGRFDPGLWTMVKRYWGILWRFLCCRPPPEEPITEVGLSAVEEQVRQAEEEDYQDDPTHGRFNLLGVQRAGLRLFAM